MSVKLFMGLMVVVGMVQGDGLMRGVAARLDPVSMTAEVVLDPYVLCYLLWPLLVLIASKQGIGAVSEERLLRWGAGGRLVQHLAAVSLCLTSMGYTAVAVGVVCMWALRSSAPPRPGSNLPAVGSMEALGVDPWLSILLQFVGCALSLTLTVLAIVRIQILGRRVICLSMIIVALLLPLVLFKWWPGPVAMNPVNLVYVYQSVMSGNPPLLLPSLAGLLVGVLMLRGFHLGIGLDIKGSM